MLKILSTSKNVDDEDEDDNNDDEEEEEEKEDNDDSIESWSWFQIGRVSADSGAAMEQQKQQQKHFSPQKLTIWHLLLSHF